MAATIGVPLYVCGGGTIPLLKQWLADEMSLGASTAFMITGLATKITNLGALKQRNISSMIRYGKRGFGMITRKIVGIVLTGLLLISSLTGCAGSSLETQTASAQETTSAEIYTTADDSSEKDKSSEAMTDTSQNEKKVLVVYYSATGTTAAVANSIAELMAGDIFVLEPMEPYSTEELNYRDDNSRVSKEYQNPDSREIALIAETVEDWDSYDMVFLGYPIWWGIAAWPVNGFVTANDFTGKTVIPFCTAASSGFGESGALLEELAGTGTWLAGERFRSGTTQEELQKWIDGLGLN